jgi:hypothetical protein
MSACWHKIYEFLVNELVCRDSNKESSCNHLIGAVFGTHIGHWKYNHEYDNSLLIVIHI